MGKTMNYNSNYISWKHIERNRIWIHGGKAVMTVVVSTYLFTLAISSSQYPSISNYQNLEVYVKQTA